MKIGIQTNSLDSAYGRWGDDTYKKLREHGYSCSDFNMSETETELYTLPQKEIEKILLHEKELASQAGIEITQVHGPWRWPVRDSTVQERSERMEKMKQSIRQTAVLGCKNWVIHPIMPYGVDEANTEFAQKTWDMNLEFMGELLKTAKEYDITICLENMPMLDFSMSKPSDILKFVRTINDEHFKICLDTGHVSVFNDLVLADEVRRLGNEIRVLHVHDNKISKDLHMMPYFGVIDWKDFAEALKEIKFNGSFSLETVPPAKLPPQIFEDMCKILAKIAKEIVSDI
ncbi:MAG: sugar phosphate isomerase/epimerase [Clostridia bacterium]|nr:sugar phosphate isomerase/epimerase [Clostridia bacterium]